MKKQVINAIKISCSALCLIVFFLFITAAVGAARELPPSFSDLVKKAAPGVVNIMATKVIKTPPLEQMPFGPDDPFKDFLDRFFGGRMPREFRQGALGSGFIIDTQGLILTNNHVVEDTVDLKVKLADNREFKAEIVGRDPQTDIALIRIKADEPLPILPLGNSDALQVGDWVVAIGNPFGLGNTVTAGIVSAKYRQIGAGDYDNFIQTDAPINPGNSGGPLLNMQGEVIGINSAILSESGGSVGIGFAIPIKLVKELLPQLRQGKVRRSYLGVMIQDITPELKEKLKLGTDSGALVSDVASGGPADKAGVRRGDVIVSFDGKPVRSPHELPLIVAATPIGKKVTLEIIRAGKKITLEAQTQELQEEATFAVPPAEGPHLGLTLQALTPELSHEYELTRTRGLLVMQVEQGSPSDDAGLQPGDIIIEVDQQHVADVAKFKRIISQQTKEGTLLLLVDRGGNTVFLTLKVS